MEEAVAERTVLVHRREHHVRKGSDFDRAFRQGQRGHAGALMLVVCDSPTEHSRLGLAVSKKVGKAVQRNRVRRLIRESFRHARPHFPRAVDVIAVPRPSVPTDLKELRALFDQAMRRALRPRREAKR